MKHNAKKGGRSRKWLPFLIAALVFGGIRAYHSGGIRGVARDAAVNLSATAEQNRIRKDFLAAAAPIGAAAICVEEFGATAALASAVEAYHTRNAGAMAPLLEKVENTLRKADRDLIDREGYREAIKLLGNNRKAGCESLPSRFDSGEFDLRPESFATRALKPAPASPTTSEPFEHLNSWCQSLTSPLGRSSVFDTTAIRSDVAQLWDRYLVAEAAKLIGDDDVPVEQDSLLAELRGDRMVGAWPVDDELLMGTLFFMPPTLYPGIDMGSPEHARVVFQDGLKAVRGTEPPAEDEDLAVYCMWESIPTFFSRWVIRSPDGELEVWSASS